MKPSEYEALVRGHVVTEFSGIKGATILLNERVDGVRQPGKYEIDIGVRMSISDVHYLTIVECKLLSRKVDRPIIQKIIQTRDAISAHKAIVVTNIGFSEEAESVARANGVGLWIVGLESRITVMGFSGPERINDVIVRGREAFAELVGYPSVSDSGYKLLDNEYCLADPFIEVARFIRGPATIMSAELHHESGFAQAFTFDGSRVHERYSSPLANVRFGLCEFMNGLFEVVIKSNSIRSEAIKIVDDFINATNVYRQNPLKSAFDLPEDVLVDVFKHMCLPINGIFMSKQFMEPLHSGDLTVPALFDINHADHLKGRSIIM